MTHQCGESHYEVECPCGRRHLPHAANFRCECGRLIEICWPADYNREVEKYD